VRRIPFDRVADLYDKSRGLPPRVMKQTVEVLAREMKGSGRILDVGVGTGRFAEPLQESGFEVVGIDIARGMMRKAKHKGVVDLVLGDICFLPFRDSSFDAALSVHVLHLISDWQATLREICRVTKDGFFSVVHVPSRSPVSQAYEDLAEEKGYTVGYVGRAEGQLKDIIKPAKDVRAVSMVAKADEYLTYLRRRAYSRQWRLPEDVDAEVVQELTRRFAGQEYNFEIHIVKWQIHDLKSMLEEPC